MKLKFTWRTFATNEVEFAMKIMNVIKWGLNYQPLMSLTPLKNFQNGRLNWIQIQMRVIFIISPNLLKTIQKKKFFCVKVELSF